MPFVRSLHSNDSITGKNMRQPLMLKFFANDTLQSYMVNCYVQGFPLLDWNKTNYLTSFPPNDFYNLQFNHKLKDEWSLIKLINRNQNDKWNKNYILFVYWSDFMKKQSKHLIKEVKEYQEKYNENLEVIYINCDNLFYN